MDLFGHWNTGCDKCRIAYGLWWNSTNAIPPYASLRVGLCHLGRKLYDQLGMKP